MFQNWPYVSTRDGLDMGCLIYGLECLKSIFQKVQNLQYLQFIGDFPSPLLDHGHDEPGK